MLRKNLLFLSITILLAGLAKAQNWGWSDATAGRSIANGVAVTHNALGGSPDRVYMTGANDHASQYLNNPVFATAAGSGYIPTGVTNPSAFTTQYDVSGNVNWVSSVVSSGVNTGQGFVAGKKIATDRNNYSYSLGSFNNSTLDAMNPVTATSTSFPLAAFGLNKHVPTATDHDLYLICHDNTGTPLWGHVIGSNEDDFAGDVEVWTDSDIGAGFVYVAGSISGNDLLFSTVGAPATALPTLSNPHSGSHEIFVIKIDILTGQIIDQVLIGDDGADHGLRLSASFTDVYLTGSFEIQIPFTNSDGTTYYPSNGGLDIFACRFNGGDIHNQTGFTAGGPDGDEGLGIATDDYGTTYLCGYFKSTVNFPGVGPTASLGSTDGYLGRVNSTFTGFDWITTNGNNTGNDRFNTVETDNCGFLYMGHQIGGTPDVRAPFTSVQNTPANPSDFFHSQLFKYQDIGSALLVWSHDFTPPLGSNFNTCQDIAVSRGSLNGPDVYQAGYFENEFIIPWSLTHPLGNLGPAVSLTSDFPTWCTGCPVGAFILQLDEGPSFQQANYGPYCLTDPAVTLQNPVIPIPLPIAGSLGATFPSGTSYSWFGSGITANGNFNPSLAGIGTHFVSHQVNYGSCALSSNIASISVVEDPWPKHPVTTGSQWGEGKGSAFDLHGGSILTGTFQDQITFETYSGTGNITLTSNGGSMDGYLARYDICGIDWAFDFGSSNSPEEGRIVRYHTGVEKLYLGGTIRGGIPSPGFQGASGNPVAVSENSLNLNSTFQSKGFVAQVDPWTGQVDWVYIIGDNVNERTVFKNLKIGPNGDLFIVAEFIGTVTVAGTGVPSNSGSVDILLLSLTTAGVPAGFYDFGSDGHDLVESLDFDAKDHILVTGTLPPSSTISLAGTTVGPSSDRDIYLAYIHNTFIPLNLSVLTSPGNDYAWDIEVRYPDFDDGTWDWAIFLTGEFRDQLNYSFGGGSVSATTPTAGDNHAFIMGMNPNQEPQWLVSGGGSGFKSRGHQLCIANNQLYTTGWYEAVSIISPAFNGFFANGISSAGSTGATSNQADVFVTEQDFDGTFNVIDQVQGTGSDDKAYDIETDGSNVYLSGAFGGALLNTISFNGAPLSAASSISDVYFSRRDFSGSFFEVISSTDEPIKQGNQVSTLSIYPNPGTGIFQIEGLESSEYELLVTDASGKIVLQQTIDTESSKIDLTTCGEGLYFAQVRSNSNKELQTFKLMIH